MKSVVLLRAVADPELAQGVWGDTCRLDEPSVVALSLALSLRRAAGGQVHGVAVGPPEWDVALREARAMGVDGLTRAWWDDLAEAGIAATARVLAEAIPADAGVVFAGSAASDHGSGVLAAALAEVLGWPLLQDVTAIEAGEGHLLAQVRAGGGVRQVYRAPTPVVLVAARMPAPLFYPRLATRLAARRETVAARAVAHEVAPGERFELVGYGPARPLTRQLLKPSAAAKPSERLRQLMSGGMGGRGGKTLEAAPEGGIARQLADLLAKEGLVPAGE
ncbi:MAG: hypothetical protein HY875_14910 [Chloroflexi bacterium]|nr:hypothetical protein [Chloroflexota bacterium]